MATFFPSHTSATLRSMTESLSSFAVPHTKRGTEIASETALTVATTSSASLFLPFGSALFKRRAIISAP